MRILVMSDSHGHYYQMYLAITQQPTATAVVLLGDGSQEMDEIEEQFSCDARKFYRVRGNCDWGSDLPIYTVEIFGGKRFYCTHGFMEKVKYGDEGLISDARGFNADIALFGHTHNPRISYEDGLYLFNPGSIADGNYGVVDVTEQGIMCIHMKVRY